jgi:PAS domain S-box-containing protein
VGSFVVRRFRSVTRNSLIAGAALALSATITPCAAAPAVKPVIVGINRDYPPYEYVDAGGRPAGFDVELARAVADVEGVPIVFKAGVWGDLVGGFKRGEIDMLAGMLQSKEREEFASFSSPHLVVHYSLFVRSDNRSIHSGDDLRGRVVLVERGSQMHEFLGTGTLGAKAEPVASEPEALKRLAGGEGDAAVVPQLEGLVLARQQGLDVRQVGGPLLTRELCFAVRKDRPELLSRLNTGLAVLYQTGRYAGIYKHWFGAPLEELGLSRYVPWALGALGLMLFALVAIGLWNRSLGRQVALATRQLREANAEILNRERFLDSVIENLPVGIFVKESRNGFALSLWNNRSEEMFDISRADAIGKTAAQLFPPDLAAAFQATDHELLSRRAPVEEFEHRTVSRSRGPRLLHTRKLPLLDEQGEVAVILGIIEDITDRTAMESALRESQRLEGLGVLAGGIAHDFNNLLTAILGNLGLAAARLPDGHPVLPLLRTVETTALRAAELTRQMLAYAGKAPFVVRPIDLNGTATEMANLLSVSISPSANLRYELATGLPAVQADPAQVQQVILNLLTNASEAIGQSVGEIVIATRLENLGERRPAVLHPASPPVPPGRYVVLTVSDTGAGMAPETLARVFDPFFTTKFTGHGLGLSAILGILRAHGAGIGIESVVGKGSAFSIYFPAIDARPMPKVTDEPVAPTRPGHGTVLVVEDAAGLRETAARMLVHLGFDVLQAADGPAALEIYARERDHILMVLTDLTMPGMSGLEVAKAIRAIEPAAIIVLMSGFPSSGQENGRQAEDLSGFLPKPFRLQELSEAIEKALTRER